MSDRVEDTVMLDNLFYRPTFTHRHSVFVYRHIREKLDEKERLIICLIEELRTDRQRLEIMHDTHIRQRVNPENL
jgi:hypothetical protein